MTIDMRSAHRRPKKPARVPPRKSCATPGHREFSRLFDRLNPTGKKTVVVRERTSGCPGYRSDDTRAIGIDAIVLDKLAIRKNNSHDTCIVSIETSRKYHAVKQECRISIAGRKKRLERDINRLSHFSFILTLLTFRKPIVNFRALRLFVLMSITTTVQRILLIYEYCQINIKSFSRCLSEVGFRL